MRMRISAEDPDELGLTNVLLRYADYYWLVDHATGVQVAGMILESFKCKITGELKLLEVLVDEGGQGE